MEENLEKLLQKIKLDDENYSYFQNGTLLKIIGNKNKTDYRFIIKLDKQLPLKIYLDVNEKIKKEFSSILNTKLIIISDTNDETKIAEYYRYFISIYAKESPLLDMFKNLTFNYSDETLTVEVNNKAEDIKFKSIIEILSQDFKDVGFIFHIKTKVNSEIENQIMKEIKEDLKVNIPFELPKVEIQEEKPKFKFKGEYTPKPLIQDPENEKVIMGKYLDDPSTRMDQIVSAGGSVIVDAFVFGKDVKEAKSGLKIISLKLTDYTDSIYGTIFVRNEEEFEIIDKKLKVNAWYKMKAKIKEKDQYNIDLSLLINDINYLDRKVEEEIIDDAPIKRVELHAHTMMSQMDGITGLDLSKHTCELVEKTIKMGYKGVAITDHNGCQAFPIAFSIIDSYNKKVQDPKDKFKGLYGTELVLVDDTVNIVVRPNDSLLSENTYVVFDTETTGFNAAGGDQMIEIGAVKIKDGEIIDRFDELIDPHRHIPDKITELTCITDEMVKGKDDEETVTKKFLEWASDLPMVAHNAKFDISFIEMSMRKYNLGEFKNTVIDTLELSRTLDQGFARHSLSALVKRYDVPWEEDAHHRADYDAEGTAYVFAKMLKKLISQKYNTISDLDKLISKDEIHKFGRTYHFNAIAVNKTGLRNLFKIISLANTTYLYKTPRILRSKLNELREGLLIGSGCYESEVFTLARSKEGQELTNIINFYDYVEVQPPEVYDHLIQLGDFKNTDELQEHIKKVVNATKDAGKIIVATGDVHHFRREDKIYREIIVNQKVPGGGRHPLAKSAITNIPSQHFRTTREMLDDFSFLGTDLAYEIVVTNTNKVLDMIDEIEVIIDTGGIPFSPHIDASVETVTDLVYTKASSWYGNPLPLNIEERIAKELYGDSVYNCCKEIIQKENPNDSEKEIEQKTFSMVHQTILDGFDKIKELIRNNIKEHYDGEEELTNELLEKKLTKSLGGIIGGGFDVIYLIAQKLVKHSNDEGFLVGSRGSVGSSFVATMMGITEVNPLAAHYRCPNCKHSIFDDNDGKSLGATYSSGFDLPDKVCPKCGTNMLKDGQDMPFATFLGFNADKVPDIDLNFSDLNQASAHAYTKVLFGEDNVYRAGTIGTVAEKTAFGFVKGYCEQKNIVMRNAEIERLAMGCTGVKRTTGQHPGGIVVIPGYMDVFNFTPFQYPAEDGTAEWRTTHFDYHAIDQCVLKLDILGHSDPTQLRIIQNLTGTDIMQVPLDDKETMGIFTSPKPLGVTKEQILCNTGTLGIPEFGTPFTVGLVEETKPTTFAELIKISGLSHGTDVWLGNAQELIKNNIVPFKETIGCRDDIMVYLMYHGVAPIKAFKIMEFVRKGKASKDKETWKEHVKTMEEAGIEKWFIDSCAKIKYMFPKAHAAAYVISAFRIAWYKVHMPVYFYASWFSSKATDVDVEVMIQGYDAIKNKIIEIQNKGFDATNKENGQLESLKIALEATARGIKFLPVDLNKSSALTWDPKDDTSIYPPFNSIDGLGDTVANLLVDEREKREFLSIEDVQKRAKVSQTLVEKMRFMGIFDGMDESSQLSLF